jgi:hypothetical protein
VIFASVEDGRLEKRNKCFENIIILKLMFREQIVGSAQVFEWSSKFKRSVTCGEDAECLDCPSVSNR